MPTPKSWAAATPDDEVEVLPLAADEADGAKAPRGGCRLGTAFTD